MLNILLISTFIWNSLSLNTLNNPGKSSRVSRLKSSHPLVNTIKFNHTTVYVEDLATSTRFYAEVMTLIPISEPFHDHKHSWFSIGPHNQLHVVQGAVQKIPHDINIHLAFTVDNLTSFMEHLKKMGVPYGDFTGLNGKIANRPDGVQQIYLQDPDGYWIEINNDRE